MSLESKIEELTIAISALIGFFEKSQSTMPVVKQEKLSLPVVEVVTPVASQMPTVDTNVPQNAPAPFNDSKGLIEYVMGAYKQLGAEKGASIQTIMNELGYQNINAIQPEHYSKLYAAVELLKGE